MRLSMQATSIEGRRRGIDAKASTDDAMNVCIQCGGWQTMQDIDQECKGWMDAKTYENNMAVKFNKTNEKNWVKTMMNAKQWSWN